jgi:hypothetical protein
MQEQVRVMKKGPYILIYDKTNTERLSSIDFGSISLGERCQDVCVWLWNKKDFKDAPRAVEVRLCASPANDHAERIVSGKCVFVKSSGILDPDNVGIVDDGEVEFSSIGDGLADPGSFHSIGDIPSNCARRLWFRLELPEGMQFDGMPRIILRAGFMSEPVKWLYC